FIAAALADNYPNTERSREIIVQSIRYRSWEPLVKRMPYTGEFPPEPYVCSMNGIVADMHGQVEAICKSLRGSHSFEGEQSVEPLNEKFRVYPCEGAMRNVEAMFYFQRRGLFPYRITSDLVVYFSDQNPSCRIAKRGAYPLLICPCTRARGHFR